MLSQILRTGMVCVLSCAFSIAQNQAAATPPAAQQVSATAVPRVDHKTRVDAGNMYHRVYAVVPLIGTGKKGDEKRPMFAPLLSEMKNDHTGILGYQMQLRVTNYLTHLY